MSHHYDPADVRTYESGVFAGDGQFVTYGFTKDADEAISAADDLTAEWAREAPYDGGEGCVLVVFTDSDRPRIDMLTGTAFDNCGRIAR